MGDAKSGPVRLSLNPQLRVAMVRSLNAPPAGLKYLHIENPGSGCFRLIEQQERRLLK